MRQDPELNYQRAITRFENNYFDGEALPVTYVNRGAMAQAAKFGRPPSFKMTSAGYSAVITNWDTWRTILAIVRRLVEDAEGKFTVQAHLSSDRRRGQALVPESRKVAHNLQLV